MTNEQLHQLAQTCAQSRTALFEGNRGLVVSIARRYANRQHMDDAVAEGNLALLLAIDTYDAKTGIAFSAYASLCIRNNILRILRNETHQNKRVKNLKNRSTDSMFVHIDQQAEEFNIEQALRMTPLDAIQRKVIECRYGFNCERMTLEQTGKLIGYSKQRVQQIEMEALAMLRKNIK